MFRKYLNSRRNRQQGQGIVEFALVLPVVLMVVFGVIEVGFLLFSYSSVNSAAREGARYGIAIGDVSGGQRYYDCSGIVDAALRIGKFAGMKAGDISVYYDNGPDEGDGTYVQKYASCSALASYNGNDSIRFGDRIVVTATHEYHPLVSYIGLNITPFTMTSVSSRTIVKNAEVIPGGGSTGPGGGGGGGGGGGVDCYGLTRFYIGSGSPPSVNITNSTDCAPNNYVADEVITLTANPDPGWTVDSWAGTDNDASVALTNTITMPAANHQVTVTYVNSTPVCHTLTPVATPDYGGSPPVASLANSPGCAAGTYVAGQVFSVSVIPNSGYVVSGWTGTVNDGSTSTTNTVSMPDSDLTVGVTYVIGP